MNETIGLQLNIFILPGLISAGWWWLLVYLVLAIILATVAGRSLKRISRHYPEVED